MIAGHTDIPVGTVATRAGVATDEGSISGSDATTGASWISDGVPRRTTSAARYATNATPAASAQNDAYEPAIERRAGTGEAEASNRAWRRKRKSGDTSIDGRLLTNIRLRRTTVSCREHLGHL